MEWEPLERLRVQGRALGYEIAFILDAGNMTDHFSLEEKAELAEKKNKLYVSLISDFTPEKLLPGVLNLLKHLKREKTKIGLTSASKNGPLLLDRLGIGEYFDAVVDPGKVKRG